MSGATQQAGSSFRASRGRAAAQPLAFVGLALAYIWIVRPTHDDWLKIPFLAVIVLVPFASNLVHRDRPRELGWRLDNLWPSAREVAMVTAAGAALVLAVGALTDAAPAIWPGMARSFLLYPFWGLVQQYAMQSFTYRRLREGTGRPVAAAALTALLFASLHYPNLALASVTLVGAYVWCRLFERHPNLFTLALSHGWLAVLLRASWPALWLHNLRIGPGYWTWTP